MLNLVSRFYNNLILRHPVGMLVILGLLFIFFALHAGDFKLDASADSLLLEDDTDLKIFRALNDRYETKDFLFLTFTPEEDLFSDSSLARIASLKSKLEKLDLVDSVVTILDVPLVKQVEGTLSDIAKNFKTLSEKNVDRQRAKQELLNSPIYSQMVISLDQEKLDKFSEKTGPQQGPLGEAPHACRISSH